MPEQWAKLLTSSAITKEDYEKNPQAVLDVLEFYTENQKREREEYGDHGLLGPIPGFPNNADNKWADLLPRNNNNVANNNNNHQYLNSNGYEMSKISPIPPGNLNNSGMNGNVRIPSSSGTNNSMATSDSSRKMYEDNMNQNSNYVCNDFVIIIIKVFDV